MFRGLSNYVPGVVPIMFRGLCQLCSLCSIMQINETSLTFRDDDDDYEGKLPCVDHGPLNEGAAEKTAQN